LVEAVEGATSFFRQYTVAAEWRQQTGDTERLAASLEEVSRLLNAYTAAILASGS
jgi:hypothetical protein